MSAMLTHIHTFYLDLGGVHESDVHLIREGLGYVLAKKEWNNNVAAFKEFLAMSKPDEKWTVMSSPHARLRSFVDRLSVKPAGSFGRAMRSPGSVSVS